MKLEEFTDEAKMLDDIPTGKLSICKFCRQPIAEIKDPYSGVLDWYSHGGDYGCDSSPDTNEEGVGSHKPNNN